MGKETEVLDSSRVAAPQGVSSVRQAAQDSKGTKPLALRFERAIAAHLRAGSSHAAAALMHREAARHYEQGLDLEAQVYGRSAQANSQRAHALSLDAGEDLS